MSRANPASTESARGAAHHHHAISDAAIAPTRAANTRPVPRRADAARADAARADTRGNSGKGAMAVLYYAQLPARFDLARVRAHQTRRMMKRKDRNERQERQAAQREAAERRRRRNALFLRGALVVAVLGAAAVAYRLYTQRHLLDAVTTATYPAGLHVAGPINYTESPPVGGTHNVVWQNCGVYAAPIHNEHAVHSMEHGAVWITYRPDLPPDQVQRLRSTASDDFILLSPYPGLASPVVASAWNHQIRLDGASDSRLQAFIARYKNNPDTTPEFGAPCAGGTGATAEADTLRTPQGSTVR